MQYPTWYIVSGGFKPKVKGRKGGTSRHQRTNGAAGMYYRLAPDLFERKVARAPRGTIAMVRGHLRGFFSGALEFKTLSA